MNPYHKSNQKYPKPQKREVEKHFDWLTFRVLDFLNNVKASYINLSHTFGYNSIFFFGALFFARVQIVFTFQAEKEEDWPGERSNFYTIELFLCCVSQGLRRGIKVEVSKRRQARNKGAAERAFAIYKIATTRL